VTRAALLVALLVLVPACGGDGGGGWSPFVSRHTATYVGAEGNAPPPYLGSVVCPPVTPPPPCVFEAKCSCGTVELPTPKK
jgi:hypothetical protein